MSRSGYTDDLDDNWELVRWRGAVASAIHGKRGQALLRDLLAALDAMPEKRLISGELVTAKGEVCALGAVACARGISVSHIDPTDYEAVAEAFDISEALAREIENENDEYSTTPENRWKAMHEWTMRQLRRGDSETEGVA